MDNFKIYRWMLAGGLGLKGLSLSLFALVFSFTRSKRTMFESEESLAECFGFSREHVNITMKTLVGNNLIVRVSKHEGLQTYDYCVDISTVVRMLGPPECENPKMLKAFYRSVSKSGLEWCEEILQADVRKSDTRCEKTSQQDVRKSHIPCEEISHNNDSNKEIDNKRDNVLSALSNEEFIELLYPVFFFKNNCDPIPEIERFVDFYKGKDWRLGGGKVMCEIGDLEKAAEAWQVKEKSDTGYRSSYMRGWREVYRIAPDHLKKEILRTKPYSQNDTSASFKCSKELAQWLDEERQTIDVIFRGHAAPNYKLEWMVR